MGIIAHMETCIDISAKAHGDGEPDEGSGLSAVPAQTAIPVPHGLQRKLDSLVDLLLSYKSMAIGFSGGVDSTFLAAVCARFVPACRVTLIHLDTPLIGTPERASFERERERFARMGLQTICLTENPLSTPPLPPTPQTAATTANGRHFQALLPRRGGKDLPWCSRAAMPMTPATTVLACARCASWAFSLPLMETGWHKSEEREVLKLWGHEVWSLPAGACLATRIPCGETLTQKKLKVVRACEDYLHELGIAQVRVRLDNGTARVSTDSAGLNVLQRLSTKEADVEGATRGVAAGKGNDAEVCTGAVGERADDGCDGTTNERTDGERDGATGSEPTSSSIAACSNGVLHAGNPCTPLPPPGNGRSNRQRRNRRRPHGTPVSPRRNKRRPAPSEG